MDTPVLAAVTATALLGWIAASAVALRLFRALHTDELTGLGNRRALIRLARRVRRHRGLVGLLLTDLDRFKAVNDAHGHEFGNKLLAAVGARLSDLAQRGEYPIRLHGDEFALWLGPIRPADADRIRDEISEALAAPYLIDGHRITVPGSVGLALAPGRDPLADLLGAADRDMYRAKNASKVTVLPTGPRRTRDQQPDHAA